MAWYDNAVFYHIYPLGLCGCAHENDGQAVPGAFNKLNAWAEHAADIGCTAIYIGPLFESGSHGYDTIDYRLVDRRLGTNAEFKDFVARCHARGQKVIVDGVFNHVGRDFFAFQELKANRENARYKDWFCDVNFWGNNEYNDGFSYGNWGGFNLLVGQLSVLHSLQTDIAKGDGGTAESGTTQAAFLPLAEFNSFGSEHYLSTSLSRISPL